MQDARDHSLGVLEVAATAVGRVDAVEVEVAASLARRVAIALDLAPLALVADRYRQPGGLLRLLLLLFFVHSTHHAMDVYRLRFARPPAPSSLFRLPLPPPTPLKSVSGDPGV